MLLTLAYDPGTSLTKVIYAIDDGDPKLLTMPPETVQLPGDNRTGLEERCAIDQFAKPEDLAWFSFKKTTGDCFAVGELARKYTAQMSIRQLKYEASEYKIVAIIGAIAQQEHLPEEFDLDLAVLLPLAEYRDGSKLQEKLSSDLKRFWWQGQHKRQANLQRWKCFPEGGGKILDYMSEVGQETFQSQNILVTMFGHRNVSILWFSEGRLSEASDSTDCLGFYQFLDTLQSYVSGYTHDDFLDAMRMKQVEVDNKEDAEPEDDDDEETQTITRLVIDTRVLAYKRVSNKQNIAAEQAELERALKLAKQEYLRQLQEWFDTHTNFNSWKEVFFMGGAYQFFKDEIDGWIKWGKHPPEDTTTESLSKALGLTTAQQQAIGGRLHDVYALFNNFRAQ